MEFNISRSNVVGVKSNTHYPVSIKVTNAEEMKAAVSFDHVCAAYEGNIRGNGRFISSNVLPMDCDNDHSDNPEDWITPEKIEELFPGISYALVFSRNHMKEKEGKSARPRFHVYFEISKYTDGEKYAALKRAVQKAYPFFDDNALDASRFLFGVKNPEVVWCQGFVDIDEDVTVEEVEETPVAAPLETESYAPFRAQVIPEGERNSTLSRFASRILKRYGNTDKALHLFDQKVQKCDPPLPESEVRTIWKSALSFFEHKIASDPSYVSPEEYNKRKGGLPLKPSDYSDLGQATVFSSEYENELVYTEGTDFIRYDGSVWREKRQYAVGAIEDFLDMQLEEARTELAEATAAVEELGHSEEETKKKDFLAGLSEDEVKIFERLDRAEDYYSFVMKRRNVQYVSAALQLSKPKLEKDISELDKDGFLLNTPDGTYDLNKGLNGRREHRAEDLLTHITAFAPGDEGTELWQATLDRIFCGDKDLIEYVQRTVGLAIIGKVYQEAMIIAFGSGSNGKSTFWNTIAYVMGTYSCTMSADSLTVGCKRNVKPEMAELKGRRLVISSELEEGMRLNTSIIKQLTSTDQIHAEKKYKDPFHFTPSHTLVLYTNYLPRVGANDEGTWRRLIVVPFNAVMKGSGDKKNYTEYLIENAGPAVMKWIIEGAQKVIADNFKPALPKAVVDATKKYREDCDWFSSFVNEECEVDKSYRQKSGQLYTEYRAWCLRMGEFARSTSEFYQALENAGFERRRAKDGVTICGLRLREEFLG